MLLRWPSTLSRNRKTAISSFKSITESNSPYAEARVMNDYLSVYSALNCLNVECKLVTVSRLGKADEQK